VKDTDKIIEPLDAILRRAMREQPGAATSECADAESLAGYSERSMAAAERERLELHFADCMRCQMLLADIARAEEHARGASPASRAPWYRRWRITIPALAAAAAVSVLIAVRRPVNDEPKTDQLDAVTRAEAPAIPAPASAPAAPASDMIAMNEAKPEPAPRAAAMSANAPQALARSAQESDVHATMAPGSAAENAIGRGAGLRAGYGASIGAFSAGRAAGAGGGAVIAGASVLVTVTSPDQSATWLVTKNGMIWRREPDGSARQQHSGVTADLVAGAAPSAAVCWVVGNGGTIIRTTDGENWTRIAAPTTDNLTAVTATSADDAAITSAGGQSFATSDGGASWHQH